MEKSIPVKVRNLGKVYHTLFRGSVEALSNINLDIKAGEFFVILGPSGGGKSTFLNLIAGLEKPTKGEIWFGDTLVASPEKKVFLSPMERDVAMVFQSYALYPHLTVYENIAFPLKIKKEKKQVIDEKVKEVARLLKIEHLLDRKPKELSGGERQRVAIGRAIVRKPKLFLMDEPLSNLDAQLRINMRAELKTLQRRLGITTLYVTHDQLEAMTLGDRIAVIRSGTLQQVGTPEELYEKPRNIFVATFIGSPSMNIYLTQITSNALKLNHIDYFYIPENLLKALEKYNQVYIGFRPEHIELLNKPGGNNILTKASVELIEYVGAEKIYYLRTEGNTRIIAKEIERTSRINEGEVVYIRVESSHLHFFDIDGVRIEVGS